ncbi:unnamed protein product [Sphagnum compactum]
MQHISAFRCGLSSCRSAHLYLLKPWCISSSSHTSAVCCSTLAHPEFTTFATASVCTWRAAVCASSTRVGDSSLDRFWGSTAQGLSVVAGEIINSEEIVDKLEEPLEVGDDVDIPVKASARRRDVGAFQQLPVVSPGYEILGSALRRAKLVRPTKGILNAAKRERNRGAKQLDALTKELSLPLKGYIHSFPSSEQLHPYEQSLLELTLGPGTYQETLERVDWLRKKILDFGKNSASICAKSTTKREAGERLDEGFLRLEELFKQHGKAVDDLKEIAKVLRAMPVVHPRTPTLCLVGAPNVGKSSLVRIISSGKPEVCNYPFTTRGISMGHFFVENQRFQVTDTPGLLRRSDDERNNIEKLTLAALSHLPTAILYVHDLTGDCGTTVPDQFLIYNEMKERFADRPWLDVVSKGDLLSPAPPPTELSSNNLELYALSGPARAIRVSVQTGQGLDELVQRVHSLLSAHSKSLHENIGDHSTRVDGDNSEQDGQRSQSKNYRNYSPAWPNVQG